MDKRMVFKNAQEAFEAIYSELVLRGIDGNNGTKKLYNVGFYIENPLQRSIGTEFRKWNEKYAEREWQWYLSKNRSVKELKKYAPIWDRMHNGDDLVNSNYGFLWSENDQLEKTIEQLRKDQTTRQAWITFFDGKNKSKYSRDTPCTLNVGFVIQDGKLCMNVFMRSNDIWFGFCNDQYCFSKLQELVANELGLPIGWYYHHAADMHVYEAQYGMNPEIDLKSI